MRIACPVRAIADLPRTHPAARPQGHFQVERDWLAFLTPAECVLLAAVRYRVARGSVPTGRQLHAWTGIGRSTCFATLSRWRREGLPKPVATRHGKGRGQLRIAADELRALRPRDALTWAQLQSAAHVGRVRGWTTTRFQHRTGFLGLLTRCHGATWKRSMARLVKLGRVALEHVVGQSPWIILRAEREWAAAKTEVEAPILEEAPSQSDQHPPPSPPRGPPGLEALLADVSAARNRFARP